MIYIFEDHEADPIPQLFMKSYDEEIASEFILWYLCSIMICKFL